MKANSNTYKEKSRDSFDKIANNYEKSHDGRFVEPMYDEIISRILQANPKSILDVGCGPGSVLVNLKDRNIKLYGIDISENMIKEARKNLGQQAELKVGDSEFIPWQDNSFDLVLCNASFHHYPNPIKSLKEMVRVLKPERCLIMGEPTAPSMMRGIINITIKYSNNGDFRIYNKKEMEKLFREAGLKPYNYKRINHQSFIINGEKL